MWVFFLYLQAFADYSFHFIAKNNSFAIVKMLKTVFTDIETLGIKFKKKITCQILTLGMHPVVTSTTLHHLTVIIIVFIALEADWTVVTL